MVPRCDVSFSIGQVVDVVSCKPLRLGTRKAMEMEALRHLRPCSEFQYNQAISGPHCMRLPMPSGTAPARHLPHVPQRSFRIDQDPQLRLSNCAQQVRFARTRTHRGVPMVMQGRDRDRQASPPSRKNILGSIPCRQTMPEALAQPPGSDLERRSSRLAQSTTVKHQRSKCLKGHTSNVRKRRSCRQDVSRQPHRQKRQLIVLRDRKDLINCSCLSHV